MTDSFDHRLVIANLKSQLSAADNEKATLQINLERLERSYMNIRDSPNVDSALRSEISRLTGQIESLENTLSKVKFENNKQRVEIADLYKAAEKSKSQNQEYLKLKDQIFEFKQSADKLQKAEALIEKYKIRIQENMEYKNNCEVLEKNLSDLTIKYNQREDHFKTLSEIKPTIERYKLQITQMEEQLCENEIENSKLKSLVEEMKNNAVSHKSEQKITNEKILELEERLADRSFQSNQIDPQNVNVHRDLLEKNKQLEIKLREAKQENDRLLERSKEPQIEREQVPISVDTNSNMQYENAKLRSEVDRLLNAQENAKIRHEETLEALAQQEKVNRNLMSSLESLKAIGGSSDYSKAFAEKITQLGNENSKLHDALKQSKAHLLTQDKLIKKLKELGSNKNEPIHEALDSLRRQVEQKEIEIQTLNDEMKSFKIATMREQRLIISAWYELGLKLQHDQSRENKHSWLVAQRRILEEHRRNT